MFELGLGLGLVSVGVRFMDSFKVRVKFGRFWVRVSKIKVRVKLRLWLAVVWVMVMYRFAINKVRVCDRVMLGLGLG